MSAGFDVKAYEKQVAAGADVGRDLAPLLRAAIERAAAEGVDASAWWTGLLCQLCGYMASHIGGEAGDVARGVLSATQRVVARRMN